MQNRPRTPPDPDFAQRVRRSFDRQGVMRLFAARLTRIEPGEVEITVPFRDDLSQQNGYFHAGVATTVMDSAGGYAGYTLMGPESSVLSVEFKINFVNPAIGDGLRCVGRVVKPGRTLTVCDLEAYAVRDGEETLCARGLQTLIQVAQREKTG